MSNINGKAYAMNLITPVYVKTSWSYMFFIPGVFLVLKLISHFIPIFPSVIDHAWLGMVFVVVAVLSLLAGLARWVQLIEKLNEFVFWSVSLISLGLTMITSSSLFSTVLIGFLGVGLLILGCVLLSYGVTWLNRFIFWVAGLAVFQKAAFGGLETLSLIHYARWVILRDKDFPRLSPDQPKEDLKYGYMFFFSNFNGSWTQYVDSFSVAIPGGLNLLWKMNLGWRDAKVETPFNGYVIRNQIDTGYYYNAYPLASSNDVKSAKKVKEELIDLVDKLPNLSEEDFKTAFDQTMLNLQADLSQMESTPIVSLANEAIERRKSIQKAEAE